MRLIGKALGELRGKARFADPRLARDLHDLPLAPPSQPLPLLDQRDLTLATDKSRQPTRPHHLEPALRGRLALDQPGFDRLGNPLDCQQSPRRSHKPWRNWEIIGNLSA